VESWDVFKGTRLITRTTPFAHDPSAEDDGRRAAAAAVSSDRIYLELEPSRVLAMQIRNTPRFAVGHRRRAGKPATRTLPCRPSLLA